MVNLFASLLSGLAGQQPQPTDVEEIVVVPKKKPAPIPPAPARNPFTEDYLVAAEQAAINQGKLPRVSGATDTGLFGLLPEKVRNSRFRDVLGAIGDGLLIGSKADPIYGPRKEQRQMGQALIGMEQDPRAAIERLAQTGAPKSVDNAIELLKAQDTLEYKNQVAENMKAYREDQNKIRNNNSLANAGRYLVPSLVAKAQDAAGYASIYPRLEALAERYGSDPMEAWGLPSPEDWEPGLMDQFYGATGGQRLSAQTSTDNNVRTTTTSAENNKRTTATSAANNQRSTATSRENNIRTTSTSRENNQRSTAAKGGGTKPKAAATAKGPLNRDVDYLKKNPTQRAAFEKRFGPGSAKKYLGY